MTKIKRDQIDADAFAGEFATPDHLHETVYAPVDHDHDGDYAAKTHNHDTVYAAINALPAVTEGAAEAAGGKNGDIHRNSTTGEIFIKINGNWRQIG